MITFNIIVLLSGLVSAVIVNLADLIQPFTQFAGSVLQQPGLCIKPALGDALFLYFDISSGGMHAVIYITKPLYEIQTLCSSTVLTTGFTVATSTLHQTTSSTLYGTAVTISTVTAALCIGNTQTAIPIGVNIGLLSFGGLGGLFTVIITAFITPPTFTPWRITLIALLLGVFINIFTMSFGDVIMLVKW